MEEKNTAANAFFQSKVPCHFTTQSYQRKDFVWLLWIFILGPQFALTLTFTPPSTNCTEMPHAWASRVHAKSVVYWNISVCLSCSVDPVGPQEEAKARIEFKPTTVGTCMLVVRFKSDKLSNINNSLNIIVQEWLFFSSSDDTSNNITITFRICICIDSLC